MASHRNDFSDEQRAEIRRAPIAAVYRVSLATTAVAADLAHEFLAADDAIHDLALSTPEESLIHELFEERLSERDLKRIVSEHRGARQSLELVIVSARLVRTHYPDEYDDFADLVMTAARTAANAVKEVSIPWYKRIVETEERAMRDIERVLDEERNSPQA
jgi:hypothetical protein